MIGIGGVVLDVSCLQVVCWCVSAEDQDGVVDPEKNGKLYCHAVWMEPRNQQHPKNPKLFWKCGFDKCRFFEPEHGALVLHDDGLDRAKWAGRAGRSSISSDGSNAAGSESDAKHSEDPPAGEEKIVRFLPKSSSSHLLHSHASFPVTPQHYL